MIEFSYFRYAGCIYNVQIFHKKIIENMRIMFIGFLNKTLNSIPIVSIVTNAVAIVTLASRQIVIKHQFY